MTSAQLQSLFVQKGCKKLYAKQLAKNDNSKNQVYFAGAVETLNILPSQQIYAENTSKGPSFKALLNFGWLLDSGQVTPAPHAKLILYSQYPEIRFSGFLLSSKGSPSALMAPRPSSGHRRPGTVERQFVDRILFLGVTTDRKVIGYLAAGNSEIAVEFRAKANATTLAVFTEVPLPSIVVPAEARALLLKELGRISRLGWIDSKQLGANGNLLPCNAPQCGGFTLEAELGIPKNSNAEPDFLGWEIKQYAVDNLESIESSKAITLMTPEPNGGFYRNNSIAAFIRKFGYADKNGKPDRLNFGGRHFAGRKCGATGLTMHLVGYNIEKHQITDADGSVALTNDDGELAASWSFQKIFEHWSHKHARAAYVPSVCRRDPARQYHYGHTVRLAEVTDPLRLLKALASGSVYYDPGIKLEQASTQKPTHKKRSQFRVASRAIRTLYEKTESVEV